jgi:hypothetical protein
MAAGAGGRGHLRASRADREQVIGTLKAAFVAGMLAKDEFDLRVGQTLAARTYADLAALTADLPAGLAAGKPPQPARPQEEPMRRPGRMIAVATAVYGGPWAYVLWTSPNGDDNHAVGLLIFLWIYGGFIAYLLAWFVAVVNMIALRREKRSGGQSPRRPAPGVSRQASRPLPSVGPDGQLPPAGPGQQQSAEAAPIRRPLLPGWRPPATTGYLTHPAQRRPAPAANPSR